RMERFAELLEGGPALLCRPQCRRTTGVVGGTLRIAWAAGRLRIAADLLGQMQDGIAVTARTKDGTYSKAGAITSDTPTPARPRSRRRAASGHDAGGEASSTHVAGSSAARGKPRHDAGGRR